jgi:hypothetical protein
MELACDSSLKIKFDALPFSDFWIYVRNEYVELSKLAIDVLLLFGTTCLCEKTYSVITEIKSKYRNDLQLESGLRVAV